MWHIKVKQLGATVWQAVLDQAGEGLLVARSALKWRLLGPAASPLMQPRKKAHVRFSGRGNVFYFLKLEPRVILGS